MNLRISDKEIRKGDRDLLLHINDIPGSIVLEEGVKFGASEKFSGARYSADDKWLAITTSGTSHGAGWLFEIESEQIIPAAFQYGGSVEIGAWSENCHFVVFTEISPAPVTTLTLVDASRRGRTVNQNSIPIRLAEHSNRIPPNTEYKSPGWEGNVLIFEVDNSRFRYNPVDSTITAY